MFRIRQEHYDAYLERKISVSRDRIIAALCEQMPEETKRFPEGKLKTFCRRGMIKAAHYGIATEFNLYYFVGAMILCGEEFDRDPRFGWAQRILSDTTLGEDTKTDLLALEVEREVGREM